tara:strand:+ start:4307 stop:4831 length:525 start_codon:yes stop_codon:yes gene_type:complete
MESRISNKVSNYVHNFKDDIIKHLNLNSNSNCDLSFSQELAQFIYDYPGLVLEKSDFAKRKRVKNIVSFCDRCMAKRAEGEQCTRKRKGDSLFCGTHIKGTPHGIIEETNKSSVVSQKQLHVIAQEIKGIIYYLDETENVYKTEDILQNKCNPQIIAKYNKTKEGEYSIPEYNI